jgi:peptidyl-prolyl cis-trans isomerase D
VVVTDEERKQFYDAHQESFREPERVRAVIVEFSPATFAAAVAPTDAEIQAAYEGSLAQYQKPEEVRARHILIKIAPDASEAEKAKARARLEPLLDKAKAGDDFAALAKAHSEDSSAANGGDLGSFGRGVMTPPFEVAAFALAPGAVSEIIETPFGLHIIKVEEKTAARQEPLEAVRGSIVESLKTQQARATALRAVETAHERVLDGEPLEKVAADLSLTVQTPPPFGASEPVGALGLRPELVKEAFATDAGEVAEIVTEPSGYSLVKVVERLPSVVPPLEQVSSKVDTEVRAKKAAALALARAEGLLTTLKEQKDLVGLAKQEGLTVEESPQIGRAGSYVPNLGNAAALKDAAFALSSEAPVAPAVYDVNGDAVVAVLAERRPADESRFANEQAALTERLQAQAEAAAVRVFLEQLKGRAQIEYGQGFIAAGGGTPLS